MAADMPEAYPLSNLSVEPSINVLNYSANNMVENPRGNCVHRKING